MRRRFFNQTKLENLDVIEQIIRREDCFARIANGHTERDSIIFVGASKEGRRLEIVTRLDEYGNVEADLMKEYLIQ